MRANLHCKTFVVRQQGHVNVSCKLEFANLNKKNTALLFTMQLYVALSANTKIIFPTTTRAMQRTHASNIKTCSTDMMRMLAYLFCNCVYWADRVCVAVHNDVSLESRRLSLFKSRIVLLLIFCWCSSGWLGCRGSLSGICIPTGCLRKQKAVLRREFILLRFNSGLLKKDRVDKL